MEDVAGDGVATLAVFLMERAADQPSAVSRRRLTGSQSLPSGGALEVNVRLELGHRQDTQWNTLLVVDWRMER